MSDARESHEDEQPIDGIAGLPGEFPVPAGLEDRVVAHLPRPASTPRRAWLSLAAALVVVATGWAGFAAGRRSMAPPPVTGDKYLLLLYGSAGPPEEEQARFNEYAAWAGGLAARGRLDSGERLTPVIRVVGPGAAGVESAGEVLGFFLVRASSLEEAESVAAECPHTRHGGTVVVRKIG